MLYNELIIGAILFNYSSKVTISDLKTLPRCNILPEEYICQIINDLISYGLVSPHFNGTANLSFSLTDFGTYYFQKLAKNNTEFDSILDKSGGEL